MPVLRNNVTMTVNGAKAKNDSFIGKFLPGAVLAVEGGYAGAYEATAPMALSFSATARPTEFDIFSTTRCLFASELAVDTTNQSSDEWLKAMVQNCVPHLRKLTLKSA